ncbi:hypothetical protein SteCoe_33546 [Stentor coeruleus]|uniref:Cyclic nucleotide-binding domain-containing protein n=1 Tax=Stentor coeruleus TaxID=5963 RepID=A0A1R2AWI2_9CILI|nr:hypothetical protein SteCoe_33546 [Stentor coeruleus]
MSNNKKWIRNSIEKSIVDITAKTTNFNKKIEDAYLKKKSKHTFFPGNEILGSRILLRNKFVIHGDSYIKVFWDSAIMLLTLAIAYLIPYSVSFYFDYPRNFWKFLSSAYLLDMALTFNTSYFYQGVRITDRKYIAINYFKTWFFIDVISSFPFENYFYDQLNYDINSALLIPKTSRSKLRYLLLFKLGRLFKYRILVFNVRDLCSVPFINKITSALSYFLAASLSLHFMACLLNIVYCESLNETYENYDKLYIGTWTRYIRFFLRSIETMTSVGYGEFTVKTNEEKILIMLVMGMTSGLLGYFVGGFQSEIEKSNQVTYYFRDILRKAKIYCHRNNISHGLKLRIMNYIRNLRQLYKDNLIKEQDILDILSGPMREEVFSYIRGHFLIKLEDFSYLSGTCIRVICYNLRFQIFGPNDLIIKQGELTNNLYFVVGGVVEVFHHFSSTTFKSLDKFSYFGEISFFTSLPRTASVKSYNYSEVLYLRQHDFFKIVDSMPRDKDKIITLRRNLQIYGVGVLKIRCYLCMEAGHVASNCTKYIISIKPSSINPSIQKFRKLKANYPRNIAVSNQLHRYNFHSIKGLETSPDAIFKSNKYLAKRAELYSSWMNGMDRKNSQIISLITVNEKGYHNEEEEDKQSSSESSNSSRKNFINFEFSRSERFSSLFSAESLNACLGSRRSSLLSSFSSGQAASCT